MENKELLWEAYRAGYDICLPNDLPNHDNNPIWEYVREDFEIWFEEKQNNPCDYK